MNKLNSNFDKEKFKNVYGKPTGKFKFEPMMWACRHFAGKVDYNVEGWIDKNNDTVYEDLVKCLQTTDSDLVQALYPKSEKIAESGKLQKTTSKQFQLDVANLVGKLKGREQHYIRCIKPNHEKKPESFKDDVVLDQIKYLGLDENVRIRKAGYFFKMPYEKFVERYKLCSKKTWPVWKGTAKEGTEMILKDMGLHKHAAYGKSKVFLKAPFHVSEMDEKIESRRSDMAALIQNKYKKFKQKKLLVENKNLSDALKMTYNDTSAVKYKQNLYQISQDGERKKQLLVVTEKNAYLMDPKSYTVKKRLQYNRMKQLFCSNLNDGVFGLEMEQEIDILLESDNKHEVMQALRYFSSLLKIKEINSWQLTKNLYTKKLVKHSNIK
jgi:myosin heavy subunit